MGEKKIENMTREERMEYFEYAKKRAERSDKFSTFALIFTIICCVFLTMLHITGICS